MDEIIKNRHDNMELRRRGVGRWRVPETVKTEVLQFLDELALGKVNRGRKISEARRGKYLNVLRPVLEFLNKPTGRLTLQDIEGLERALTSDQIRSRSAVPYSASTKVDIRKALRIYLRWRRGAASAMKLAGWLDTHVPTKTPEYLKELEVEQLYRKCRTAKQRFLVAVLFDSGARAEEFINIRYEDIHLPEGKDNFVKITLKEEYSKTKGRTISLYWRHSLGAVTEYVTERIAQGIGPKDPVFNNSYDAMRMFLARLGESVLKRHVHPHLFRHSSATYYATRLNRQEVCYRYGWKFSSDMPDVYISRAGMENRDLDQKFTATELSTVKDDLAQVEQAAKIKDDRIAALEKSLATLQSEFAQFAEVLKLNPAIADVEAALRRKRDQETARA